MLASSSMTLVFITCVEGPTQFFLLRLWVHVLRDLLFCMIFSRFSRRFQTFLLLKNSMIACYPWRETVWPEMSHYQVFRISQCWMLFSKQKCLERLWEWDILLVTQFEYWINWQGCPLLLVCLSLGRIYKKLFLCQWFCSTVPPFSYDWLQTSPTSTKYDKWKCYKNPPTMLETWLLLRYGRFNWQSNIDNLLHLMIERTLGREQPEAFSTLATLSSRQKQTKCHYFTGIIRFSSKRPYKESCIKIWGREISSGTAISHLTLTMR